VTADEHQSAAKQLLSTLARSDIRVAVEGGKLRVNAPKGALTDALKAALASQRDALIQLLAGGAESPAANITPHEPIRHIPRTGALPLSSAQRRFWFLDQIAPGRPEYNTGVALRIRGPLDRPRLQRALDALVARHESLRTRFVATATGPAAEILGPAPASLAQLDLAALEPGSQRGEMHRVVSQCVSVGFDLAAGRLCRFALIRMSDQEHVLAVIVHHIVSDGWSLGIAVEEIFRLYELMGDGRQPALPPLRVQYVDYAAWEREQLQSGRMAQQVGFWKQQLAGAPVVLELPLDRPRPATQSFRGGHLRRQFSTVLLQSLKETSRRCGTTLFMTLLAAWQVLLHRYSRQDDIVVGSPVASRDPAVLEGLIGCLVNNLVLRADLAGNPTFSDYLARVKRLTLDAFEHANVPFDALVEQLNPPRSTSHAPLFQVMFNFLAMPLRVTAPEGLKVELLETELADIGTHASRFDLTLDLNEVAGSLLATYEFATDLFDQATIERLHGHFETLLGAIVADPSRRLGELPLLTPEESVLLDKWNSTASAHDVGLCVHHLLEDSVRVHADRVAVCDADEELTYSQLDERANRLAHLLRSHGVTRGSLVGVCLDRTVDVPVALAAVLKAGAAYVPLDPTHPADRLTYTLQDAGVSCVITLSRFSDRLVQAGAPLLSLDELTTELAAQPSAVPATGSQPSDLAYVIYTSGSTGRPKGVEVEHRNVVSFLEAMRQAPGLSADDVLLAVTTLSFDIAGLEMWLPLAAGARIVIASRTDVLDGQRLIDLMESRNVTLLQATPATWRLLLEAQWRGRPKLKALCGGEALPPDLVGSLLARVGQLWNVYGPTETTIWSTAGRIQDASDGIPIGRPIANTRIHVLEPSGQPAPVGVPGELCIAGEGVARGYRNRPELTAEKFVTLRLPNGRDERLYRTGDLARWRADGQLEFIGRRDNQVKVRGYRIELGEIEAVLARHAGVKECVVAVREDTPGDRRLTGYVVPVPGVAFNADAARGTLRAQLPEYMIPGQFVTLQALPLTPNGKIDRKALAQGSYGMPSPAAPTLARDVGSDEVSMTPTQRQVAAIWRDVLQASRVGVHDNFFDLGGHSLLLVKLHRALNKEFGRDIALVELFQHTTVAAQAERMSKSVTVSDAVSRAQARAARQLHG
jgi:amino acid adenylation domain-containing protein